MSNTARYAFSAACFLGAAGLLATMDFADRGPHFRPAQARAKTDRAGTYDLARARITAKVVGHIRSHYVDPARVHPKEMAVAALRAVQRSVPEVMVRVTRDRRGHPVALDLTAVDTTKRFPLDRVGDLYELNWKLMDIFDFLERHLPPSADLEELEYDAINGMLETLDPHSLLLSPRVYREMQVGTKGKFGGLGIVISIRRGMLTIMSVMEGTPAERAGLKSGDKITQIGEESTINMPLNDAVNQMRGEPGSDVEIWVRRQGWSEPRAFRVTREEIRIRSVDHEPLGDGVGYVRIRNFQGTTFEDLQDALEKLSRAPGGLHGLVIDLRDNPGGLLDQAIKVSDRFIAEGTLVTTVGEGGRERNERHATRADTLADLPLVVLINGGSASASEIVSGALKNDNRALIVGTTSFGKGSVQVLYNIEDAALKLTIAQYLTPGDVSIQSVGIVPDVEVVGLTATRDHVSLRPRDRDAHGEARLESHLDSNHTRKEHPSVVLPLVTSADEGDDGAAGAAGTGKGKHRAASDPRVRLARDLLLAAPSPDRRKALLQAAGFLAKRKDEQEHILSDRLRTLGVDWSAGANPAKPKLVAVASITGADGKPRATFAPGEEVRVTVTVTNRGKRDVFRVAGSLSSDIRAIDGRQLAFGHLAPGEQRRWTVTAKLPMSQDLSGDVPTVHLWAGDTDAGEETLSPVATGTLPRARLAYSYQLIDEPVAPSGKAGAAAAQGREGAAENNGDGLLQRGETVTLRVALENVGAGAARDVLATIKNESGEDVFIRQGRARVGAVARGGRAVADFSVHVKPSLKARTVQLQLALIDQDLRSWSRAELSIPVFPPGLPAAQPARGFVRAPAAGEDLRGGAHERASVIAHAAPGATLEVVAKAGEWLHLRTLSAAEAGATPPATPAPPFVEGWAKADRMTPVETAPADPAQAGAVTPVAQGEPPALDLQPLEPLDLVVSGTKLRIQGQGRFQGPGRRYVYIFHGEDKVLFRSAQSADASRDVISFDTAVALDPGSNDVTIVARQGETNVTRTHLTVFRR